MKTLGIATLLIVTLTVLGAALATPASAAGPVSSNLLAKITGPLDLPTLLPSGTPRATVYVGNATRGDLKFLIHHKACSLMKIPKNTAVKYCTFSTGRYQWEAWGWCGRPVYAAGWKRFTIGKWGMVFRCG